ncbi:MAG TPA: 3-dehydroquinate synthase [Firmicutes bacterium]|nr:3-dehydroquinate synthase [Bacillota bacterium]
MNRNLFLIGMPGTGKTTVGRLVASLIGMEFVDTDRLIEETAGISIEQIFGQYGERYFRTMEREAIGRVCALRNSVISLGGGAVTDDSNVKLIKASGIVVLLRARLETLVQRLEESTVRPLLGAGSRAQVLERLAALERARHGAYLRAADIVVDAEARPVEVADTIIGRLGLSSPSTLSGAKQPPTSEELTVHTQIGQYSIHIGEDLKSLAARELRPVLKDGSKAFVVSNPLVAQLRAWKLIETLREAGFQMEIVLVGDGEEYKTLEEASKIYDFLAAKGADRSSVLVAVGGGVTGDLAGFVAATYMRGLTFVQVPTTLLAQVDSSIGGKVAVDHPAGKNLIGAFHQPRLVLTDITALRSLPDALFSDGMAEAIKTAIIGGEELFEFVEMNAGRIATRELDALRHLVAECAKVKARIVEQDERDSSLRMVLNLGHTFGHAIEAACQYKNVSHGRAVAVGTCIACRLSEKLGFAAPGLSARVERLMRAFELPTTPVELVGCPDGASVKPFLSADKKRQSGSLRLVLPFAIGDVRVVAKVPPTVVDELFHREWGSIR